MELYRVVRDWGMLHPIWDATPISPEEHTYNTKDAMDVLRRSEIIHLCTWDDDGPTGVADALLWALIRCPGTEMFKLLLEHGADPNVRIRSRPLLHYVAEHSDIVNERVDKTRAKELLELMWDARADFWILDKSNEDAIRAVSIICGEDYILEQTEEIMELLRGYQNRLPPTKK